MSRARDFADLAGSADAGGLTGRNLIINGAMQVAQRGTTSGSKTATGFHTLDRWEGQASGATYELDQLTMSDSDRETYGFEKYLHFDVTTGNNNCAVAQKIEAKNLFHTLGSNQKFTLSFLAKGTNPNGGTVDARFFWTDGTNYGTQTNEDVTLTSSWQQFSITIDAPAVDNSVDVDNASAYLNVSFAQPSGDTSTNAWNIDVTGVQLEIGEQATPFEHEPYAVTLQKAQRFYYRIESDQYAYFATGSIIATSDPTCPMTFPVALRVTPSMTASNTACWYNTAGSIVAVTSPGVHYSSGESNINTLDMKFAANASLSNNSNPMLYAFNPAGHLDFDAEL